MALTKVAPAGIGSTPGDGYRIGSSFLHATGVNLTHANVTGIVTAAQFDGKLNIGIATFTDDVTFTGATSGRNVFFDKSENSLEFGDYTYAKFGVDEDLSIFSQNTLSVINNKTGELRIPSAGNVRILKRHDGSGAFAGELANFKVDGAVELFNAGSKKFSTSGIGVTITGQLDVGNVNSTGVITATKFVGDIAVGSSITYADNEKAYFGTDLDLKLFHNGTRSYIQDNISNDLRICANDIRFRNGSDGSTSFYVGHAGETQLYNNQQIKLTTIGAGVSVYGGILISEDNAIHFRGTAADDADAILRQSAGGGQLLINSRNDTILNIDSNNDSTDAHFAVAHGAATGSSTELFRVQEDGKVLIGTTTPAHWSNRTMSIYRNGDNFLELRGNSSNGCGIVFSDGTGNSTAGYPGYIFYSHADDSMRFHGGGSGNERLRIDSVGRHGINVTNTGDYYSASDDLIIREKDGGDSGITIRTGTANSGLICFADGASSSSDQYRRGQIRYHHNSDSMDFTTAGNDARLTIDSTGRVSAGKHGVGSYNDASEWFKVQSNDSAANISIVGSNDTHSSLNLGDEDDFNIQKIRSDHTNNYLQFFTNDAERLRITPGAAEQATLVIDHVGTNGATFIADNYTADGTEHTWSIGNMYSGGGFFAGYAMKPKGDGWGFVSSTDAYSDRRSCLTLNGSGYDAFRIDATDANQQITTNSDVTTVNVFAIEHSGNVKLGSNNPILKIDTGNANAGSNLRIEIDGTEEFRIDPGSIEYKNSNNATRGVLLAPNNYYNNQNHYIDLTQWRLSDSWHILEVFGTVNPNSSGSGAYVDPCHFYIYRGQGWDSGIYHWLYCASVAPPSRHAFPSGTGYAGNAGISAVWYDGSNIVGNKSATSTHYVRLLVPNANAGANFQKNFRVMRRF